MSPFFGLHVLGKIIDPQESNVFSFRILQEAASRHGNIEPDGQLHVGVCAGQDSVTYVMRRGQSVLSIDRRTGEVDPHEVVESVLRKSFAHAINDESVPIVCVDAEGDVGMKVRNEFRAYSEEHPKTPYRFQFVPFRASRVAERDGAVVHRNRDLLWYLGAKWIRDGGAIPDDPNLLHELNAPNWCQLNSSPPLLKITPADELSKKLGRQPQVATAFLLSLWQPAVEANPTRTNAGKKDFGIE